MKRILVVVLALAACTAPQPKPNQPETGPVAQTPAPVKPPGAAVTGAPTAPPAAGQPAAPTAPAAGGSAVAQPKPEPPVIDESATDKSAGPCTAFYQSPCGNSLKSTPIPPRPFG